MTDVPGSGDGSGSAQMLLVWVFLQCVDSNVDPLLSSFIMEKESVPSFNCSRSWVAWLCPLASVWTTGELIWFSLHISTLQIRPVTCMCACMLNIL